MTNWERWLLQQENRKHVICSVVECGKDCVLYGLCQKSYENDEEFYACCDEYLDSQEMPTREAVIVNLGVIRKEAEDKGYGGYVKTLDRAIELLKEG